MTLGLFPLNLVVFPYSQIPLHVFEPRYRTLINECLSTTSTFGINLVEHGTVRPVGCEAKVVEVTSTYADGRMDILVQGVQRYRILEVRENTRPFVVAEVDRLVDEELPVDTTLVADCVVLFNQIIELVYRGSIEPLETAELDAKKASFIMAPKSGLTTEQKQKLIELTNENARLEFLRDHLVEIVPTIKKAELIQRVVQSDGYLPATEE